MAPQTIRSVQPVFYVSNVDPGYEQIADIIACAYVC